MNPILSALAVAGFCLILASCDFEPKFRNLSAWEKHTARPGFRLLDSSQTDDYFISVYDTGKDEIAFCYRWKSANPATAAQDLGIWDVHKVELSDHNRANLTDLNWRRSIWLPPPFSPITTGGSDGIIYPIRPGYRGKIWISFRDDDGLGGNTRTIFEKWIDLNPAP